MFVKRRKRRKRNRERLIHILNKDRSEIQSVKEYTDARTHTRHP